MQLLPPEEEAEEEEKGEEEEEGLGGTLIQQPYPSPQNPPEPGLGGWGDPPPPPRWGGLDISTIIYTITATKNISPFLSPISTMGRITPLKWLKLRFVCRVATDVEVPEIWGEVAAAPTKQ